MLHARFAAERWIPPKKTVFLACLPRSGSHLLASYLEGARFGIALEHFNEGQTVWRRKGQDSSVASQARYAVEDGTSPTGICGIKLMLDHCERAEKEISLCKRFTNSSWIYLRRRDIVGQAISYVIAAQTVRWTSDAPARSSPRYSFEQIKTRLDEIVRSEAAWSRYFTIRNIRPLNIWYEDFVEAPQKFIALIANHIREPLPSFLPRPIARVLPFLHRTIRPARKYDIQRNEINEHWRRQFVHELSDEYRKFCNLAYRQPCCAPVAVVPLELPGK